MSTLAQEIETGDIIELALESGDWVTAMVLLATPEAIILDLLDGSMPLVARADELGGFRTFTAATAA